MKFGKIPNPDLSDLIFEVGLDTKFNPSVPFEFRFGLSKWGDPSWKGSFYPETISSKNYLELYASLFSTVEVNATYYRIFKPEVGRAWKEQVRDNSNFKFVLKVPAALSGLSEGNRYQRILDDWLILIDSLGESYGTSFIQYNGKPGDKAQSFLDLLSQFWPKDLRLNLELRHPNWFNNSNNFEITVNSLSNMGIGLVITDTPGRQDVKHCALTAPHSIIRFVGYDFNDVDSVRIEYWKKMILKWKQNGVEQTYFLFHNPNPVKSLEMGNALIR